MWATSSHLFCKRKAFPDSHFVIINSLLSTCLPIELFNSLKLRQYNVFKRFIMLYFVKRFSLNKFITNHYTIQQTLVDSVNNKLECLFSTCLGTFIIKSKTSVFSNNLYRCHCRKLNCVYKTFPISFSIRWTFLNKKQRCHSKYSERKRDPMTFILINRCFVSLFS